MEDLNADELRFIQIMFPHLLEPDSPHSLRVQSSVSATPRHSTPGIVRETPLNITHASSRQAHSIPGIMRTSSPLNVTRISQVPDWGTPITEDYQDPVSPARYSRSPQQRPNYTINSDRERVIPARHRSQPTAEFSWDVRGQPQVDTKNESLLRKFDRSLQVEYSRRRKAYSAGLSNPQAREESGRRSMLAIQADNLAKAEALALYSEAVEAAERAAAAQVDPSKKEYQAARAYDARLVEGVSGEAESGGLPIEVVAYVGVTVPKNPIPQTH